MRFRLRTLMIWLAILPPILAAILVSRGALLCVLAVFPGLIILRFMLLWLSPEGDT